MLPDHPDLPLETTPFLGTITQELHILSGPADLGDRELAVGHLIGEVPDEERINPGAREAVAKHHAG
jgi:hypothetical protein